MCAEISFNNIQSAVVIDKFILSVIIVNNPHRFITTASLKLSSCNMSKQNLESSTQFRVTRSGTSSKNAPSNSPKVMDNQLHSHSNDDIMAAIAELRNESHSSNNSVLESLSELNNKFQNLSSLVSELKLENTKLRSELDDLKLKINNPDTNISSVETSSLITHVLQETFEREKCAFNAIIYGITESALSTNSQRISDDRVAIHRILEPFGDLIPTSARVKRLGKARKDNTRPIKIIFGNKEDADGLIAFFNNSKRNESIFPDGFRIVRDKTILQRQLLRTCHAELEQRNKNGEQDLRISFVNGLPKVITTRSKN